MTHKLHTPDTNPPRAHTLNTRQGTMEATIGLDRQDTSWNMTTQSYHAYIYTQNTLNSKNRIKPDHNSVGSKYPTQQTQTKSTPTGGENRLRQSQPRPAITENTKTCTHTCKEQILTRPSQARGEVTHNKTQNSNSLWINHTMRRKIPSLSQRRGKSHTHTIVHHRHTMTNSNTLIRLNHKETQAQTWVGLVSSSENRLLRKPSDQQKSYATTSVSQTQKQPNYTTGIHSTTNSPTEIDKSDTYSQHRHITHQERPSRLDHRLPPVTRMDGRYDTRKHNTKYNHGSLTHRKSKIYATSNSTTNLVHQTSTSGTVNAPQTGRGKFRQEMRSPVSANNTKMRLVEKTKSHSRDGNQNRANPLFHDLISATDDTLTANQNPSTIQRINMSSTRLLQEATLSELSPAGTHSCPQMSWPKYTMMAGCVSSATEALNQNMPD